MAAPFTDQDAGQRLLLGALRAFQQRGLRAVSTTDLARELGISKATLYAHFPSKEALVRATLLHLMNSLWAQGQAAAQEEGTPRQQLRAFFTAAAQASEAFPPGVVHDLTRDYPHLLQELLAYRAVRLERLATVLHRAQQQGHVRAELDVPAVVRVIQALVDSMTTPAFQERAGLTPQQVPSYVGLLIDGLFTVAGRTSPERADQSDRTGERR